MGLNVHDGHHLLQDAGVSIALYQTVPVIESLQLNYNLMIKKKWS